LDKKGDILGFVVGYPTSWVKKEGCCLLDNIAVICGNWMNEINNEQN